MGIYNYQTAKDAVSCPRVIGQYIFNSRDLANAKCVVRQDRRRNREEEPAYLHLAISCIVEPEDLAVNTSDNKDFFVARLSEVIADLRSTPDF